MNVKKTHSQRTLAGFKRNKPLKRRLRQKMTTPENKLWLELKDRNFRNLKFRRQHGIGPYIVDFYCAEKRLVIEIDGDVHAQQEQMTKDKKREDYFKELELQMIRYCNDDILTNLDGVLEDLDQRV